MTNQVENRPQLDSFVEPFFFFSYNEKSVLLYVSDSIQQVLGYHPSELLGHCYLDLLDENSSLNENISDVHMHRFKGGGPITSLRVLKTRDQNVKVLSVQTHGKRNKLG